MFCQQSSEAPLQHTQNFQGNWRITDTRTKNSASRWYLCNTSHLAIISNWYDSLRLHRWLQFLPDLLFLPQTPLFPDAINNTRNLHYWAQQNSHKLARHFQKRFELNICYGRLGNNLFGPNIFEGLKNSGFQELFGK